MTSTETTKDIVLFETMDKQITLQVPVEGETVWLTQAQMAELFDTTKQNISLHIRNCFRENELEQESVVKEFFTTATDGKNYKTRFYNLDVIISVGYRVKSKRGVEFRKWANGVLKQYILKGYATNDTRLKQLGEVVRLLRRTEDSLDSKQVLSVIERYSHALDLLDEYDHQTLSRPKGTESIHVLTYDECMDVIKKMRFGNESDLFGREKDDSFKGTIGNIYQSFGGTDLYPTMEEKAANLLYLVTKNHSFLDGNKRIAATMFLYFLDSNGALFQNGRKRIEDYTLVALTIMIAESQPQEKETMISVVLNCMEQ